MLFSRFDLGVAVEVTDGLVVPFITDDSGSETLLEIAPALRDLPQKSQSNQLNVGDFTRATFTVTNLGAHDVEFFNPFLNPPEFGNLGVGSVTERAGVGTPYRVFRKEPIWRAAGLGRAGQDQG